MMLLLLTLMLFQTSMTDFRLWNVKEDVLITVHTMKIGGVQNNTEPH